MESSRPIYLQGKGRGKLPGHKESLATNTNRRPAEVDRSLSKAASAYSGNSAELSDAVVVSCAANTGQGLGNRSAVAKSNEAKWHGGQQNKQKSLEHPNKQKLPDHPNKQKSPEHPNNQKPPVLKNGQQQQPQGESLKFQAAVAVHKEATLRHLASAPSEEYQSSSSEDELEDANNSSVLDRLKSSFGAASGYDLGRTEDYISNALKNKANICLICIATIKRMDAVWCCVGCYTMFHIPCIHKWVKDGVYQQTTLSDEHFPKREQPWFCPKCRHEYSQAECPKRYLCFCGKEEDPVPDAWLVPHSCGQVCKRRLKPDCGHSCLLLCHPGPCPSCPQTVRVSCHCQKQPLQVRRCGASEWSCNKPCRKPLACGQHSCQLPCHAGQCLECPETYQRHCLCGRHIADQPCASPRWQCEEVCEKELSCGHHRCMKVCHEGDCGDCPKFGSQSCPCGKTKFDLPCTEDVPTCLETCGKPLDCGAHLCTQKCHPGPCGMCREMVRKKCRCGKRDKEVQCFKEFLCETKCNNMRDCGNHPCKRKCCDGNCPPCTATCSKTLGCHQHKCESPCHGGPCYPCPLNVTITCNCGTAKLSVPCGAEKFSRPPRCSLLCKKPPDCHHPARDRHHCHFGSCPPCRQICGKQLTGCAHLCPARCHEAILTKVKDSQPRVGPWEGKPSQRVEILAMPCPPCKEPVSVTCLGRHETISVECCNAVVSSCHRRCGRLLSCGNHRCQLPCHTTESTLDADTAGENCERCEEPCSRPRPEGCNHGCLQPCHPGDCSPCVQMVRMRCHCQLVVLYVECDRWTHADDRERERLQSCQSKCPKQLPCGHQCKASCHLGSCPNPKRCVEKVKVRCPCRRRKGDFLCNELQSGLAKLECDEACFAAKEKQDKERAEMEKSRLEEEARRQQEELEDFERKVKGIRKRKPRRQRTEEDMPTFFQKYRTFIVVPLFVGFVAGFVFWLISK